MSCLTRIEVDLLPADEAFRRLTAVVDAQVDLRHFGALKAGLLATDGVGADGERGEPVAAVRASACIAGGAGGVERGGDGGVGKLADVFGRDRLDGPAPKDSRLMFLSTGVENGALNYVWGE